MELVERHMYMEKVTNQWGEVFAIVLARLLRVGKSCIMRLLRDESSLKDNVISIDNEQRQSDSIRPH